ncbi:type I restriction-modification system, restriction subunit R [Citrobacter freundii ATCC 8090 = MTCC 1658 = NBRC 12681]|uniref:EcoAI/FtnUII family type I restriction enzme subunit R n=1 Tax=Citrobacter freundii TaxID=546 RepID=UPI000299B549|nr:DEAD/DEAH box helicase family protein [Citrobacter freundii]EKS57554.1 type I restriction-modification enzyme R subunit [Citrobacter freundii ATCC 8090 = MTCC 1658 = NBRC 12681]EXF30744.1 DEAD/DEAH box helicase [Citrobacter freundii RLS1]KFB97818.1 type I restriction-modification system, restriction subunit R [Citrobacter freundii ATCC 8090 = MTCC 1658 = NBRC 12681]MBJ8943879.1 DEAD/DEAH box helicase family protein [Citrobacter freundii]MEB0320051.1 DEAD/DEAH box helicase family protein [Ci
MADLNLSTLTEADIITKRVMPAILDAGWNDTTQIRQEVKLRDGKVIVRGKVAARRTVKSADIVLYHKPGIPLAVIEAKANKHEIGKGMQQGIEYARLLDVPFVFATNGDGFIFRDATVADGELMEKPITLGEFPSPSELWQKFCLSKGYTAAQLPVITQDYYDDGSGKAPRYYQLQAINKTIEAVSAGQNRVLLVMATGTGKTYTAFQIIWRLWKAKSKKRILFLADRNILVDQTKNNDFLPFGTAMTKVTGRTIDPAFEIHLALYQAITGPEEDQKAFKQVAPDFFDLIVIDECHRGSASEDSAWREILDYFSAATQIGLTATPKETHEVSSTDYFGDPVYIYSLKEGIEDGFLAPYKVVRVDIDVDLQGWRPTKGQTDKNGELIDDRIYNQKDFDRTMVIDERTELVAKTITDYLKRTNPMDKTIIFCNDIDHAERMRRALVNLNPEQVKKNDKYVMKITGDDDIGKAQLDNFINPKKAYPVIATTSELMTTGVDAKTCKLVVLDQNIQSMTKFKQIIGRGTRIDERYGKLWFTILDFKKATELFADERFDGIPEKVMDTTPEDIADPESDFEEQFEEHDEEVEDVVTGADEDPAPYTVTGADDVGPLPEDEENKVRKFHVNGVAVGVIAQRVQYYDADGKLVTESFKDYTRKTLLKEYASLDDFTRKWQDAERKEAIIKELEQQGIIWEVLAEEVGKELDPFDMLCHVVYGQPPLTRKERAENVRKRNYFTKYSDAAQAVLNTLLDKYADAGVQEIESIQVLKLKPFDSMGTLPEIIKSGFGDRNGYNQAISELESEIYHLPPRSA